MARREFLTDSMWKKLEPLLPRLPKGKAAVSRKRESVA